MPSVEYGGGSIMFWGYFSSDGADVFVSVAKDTDITQFSLKNIHLKVNLQWLTVCILLAAGNTWGTI